MTESRPYPLAIQLTLGMGLWLTIIWLTGLIGVGLTMVIWAITLIGVLSGIVRIGWAVFHRRVCAAGVSQVLESPDRKAAWPWQVILIALPLGPMLTAAACPPGTIWAVEAFGYDVMSYHLQLPRHWLELGRIAGLDYNVYSFLPSLIETGFLAVGALRGSMRSAIYDAQLLHVIMAVLAAINAGAIVRCLTRAAWGWLAAALMLATPWTLITGSLAYNEMGTLAMAGLATYLVLCGPRRMGTMAVAGVACGWATLAKLFAGPMVAVPLGLIVLLGWRSGRVGSADGTEADAGSAGGAISGSADRGVPLKRRIVMAVVLTLAGSAMLAPWLVRNGLETGNPVFPFALDTMGQGHWNDRLAQQWKRTHQAKTPIDDLPRTLWRQWGGNEGFAAIGGSRQPAQRFDIARFDHEMGVSPLLLMTVLGIVVSLRSGKHRWAVLALTGMLIVQLLAWLTLTMHPSRYLLMTLLPMSVLAAMGAANLERLLLRDGDRWRNAVGRVASITAIVLVVAMTLVSIDVMLRQTRMRTAPGQLVDLLGQVRVSVLSDAADDHANAGTFDGAAGAYEPDRAGFGSERESPLDLAMARHVPLGDHPINHLPAGSRTLLVADASVLYIDRPIRYSTAFDASPLGELWRRGQGEPAQVTRLIKAQGLTHVWVNWAELSRISQTIGHDPDVTPESLDRLIATGWRLLWHPPMTSPDRPPHAMLFALP